MTGSHTIGNKVEFQIKNEHAEHQLWDIAFVDKYDHGKSGWIRIKDSNSNYYLTARNPTLLTIEGNFIDDGQKYSLSLMYPRF